MSLLRRRAADPTATLGEDLDQLRRLVDIAEGHLSASAVSSADALVQRAARRQSLATGRTVVALLGATGSGKSSLFNALVGRDVARTAARRPTTSRPLAAVFGDDDAGELLDWLEVPERTSVPASVDGQDLSGLVLLDLPDIDSTATEHRQIAARMARTVDVLVWVLDPQKYADNIVHRHYLAPMAEHAEVTVVVLNQIDTLEPDERQAVLSDLAALLGRDGLGGVDVLATSARDRTGVAELRRQIGAVTATTRAARARLAADVRTAAAELARAAEIAPDEDAPPAEVGRRQSGRLVAAAAEAAGVDAVRDAVRGSYVRSARGHVGWPPVRWLARFRPDPLRRLHLGAERKDLRTARTSLPGPTPVQEAAVRSAAHALVASSTTRLPGPWRDDVLQDVEARIPALVDALDQQVAGAELEQSRRPGWWRVLGVLQWLFLAAAIVGALWLGVLAGLGYLQMPEPVTPMAGPLPWPTALLAGGVVVGLLLALLGGVLARWGARRRARRVERRLREVVGATVGEQITAPLEVQLAEYASFHTGVRTLAG